MHIRALVFDLDGTLVDTEHWWDEVRRSLAAEDGVPWPEDATTAMMGMATAEWGRYLAETVGIGGTPEQAARRTIDAMAERLRRDGVPALPGAREAINRMARAMPIAVATSSPRRLIDVDLDLLGVTDLFATTVSSEEVETGKPHPAVYLEACRRLGVDPHEAVAVEDSGNGIRSALAAGMVVIAIPPYFHPPGPDLLNHCHAVLENLDELTTELLQKL